ncbi:MAG TPA: hypothetical protein DDW92_00680 [Candidatus Veblenbacteria bacterium]|nr:hypothetical protein [Candidatus Veblenbacteria bacterium]
MSAVPAGLVIAREEVLGINNPKLAIIGVTTMVVRLPGKPPMECLSTTSIGRFICSPVSAIALER